MPELLSLGNECMDAFAQGRTAQRAQRLGLAQLVCPGRHTNHRDEEQYIGVGEVQVRSPRSVDRHPAMAVASYARLLLAAARAFGTETPRGRLP